MFFVAKNLLMLLFSFFETQSVLQRVISIARSISGDSSQLTPLTKKHPLYTCTHSTLDINSKEILALANVLDSFSSTISNSWVDAFTDSQVLLQSWSRQGAKSPNVIAALKQLFAVVSRSNIHLSLHHIPSCFNLADTPSRRFSLLDSMLSSDTWAQVQGHFGGPSGHSVDLMALPSNVQHASSGHPLPFFSPVPSPGASGVNVFSQLPHHHPFFHNPYAFLPIILLPKLLHFLSRHGITCTLVVPDVHPRKFRWPLLQRFPSARLATRGTQGIVLPPTKHGFSLTWPLPWDLWVFRFIPLLMPF
jgi:hypothetical protein